MIVTEATPALNGIGHLAECLALVRKQSRDIRNQHVIADRGSTDDTVAMPETDCLRVKTGKDRGSLDLYGIGTCRGLR